MSASPFEIFRRHQIMTVVLIGLAMLSFVIFGAVQDPGNIPAGLWIFALAFIVGGVAWISGLQNQRQNEWGVIGLAGGAVLGMAFAQAVEPAQTVDMIGGGMSNAELQEQIDDRARSNAFLQRVYAYSAPEGARGIDQTLLFDVGNQQTPAQQSAVDWEILLREADRLGISVNDETVNEYLKTATNGAVTRKAVQQAASDTGRSVVATYDSLKRHIAARIALRHLVSRPDMTPADYFDFYRRMNEERQIDAVRVPVEAFTADIAEPDDAALQAMFAEYRANYPNTAPDGSFEGGRPGFYQPPQIQVAAVEFSIEELKKRVEQPTEEELQEAYDAEREFDLPEMSPLDTSFPPAGLSVPAAPLGTPDGEASPDGEMSEEAGEGDVVEEIELSAPALPTKNAPAEKPEKKESENAEPAIEEKAPESSEEADDTSETGGEDPAGEPDTAALKQRPATYSVAFQEETESVEETTADDEEKADDEANASVDKNEGGSEKTERKKASAAAPSRGEAKTTAASAPPAEKSSDPAVEEKMTSEGSDGEKPAGDEKSADGEAAMTEDGEAGDGETADTDPPPAPGLPAPEIPTFEERKEELREQMVSRRALELQQRLVSEANLQMVDLKSRMRTSDEDDGLTPDQVHEEIKKWAEERGGVFMKTPMASAGKLIESGEPPIAAAEVRLSGGRSVPVPRYAEAMPAGREFESTIAEDFETGDTFVWWKADGKPSFPPQSLEDEGVREQVVEAYRKQEAMPLAEKRAEAIAAEIREAVGDGDKTVDEILEGTTVTGKDGGDEVEVKTTPTFSWLVSSTAGNPNPFFDRRNPYDLNEGLQTEDSFSDEFMEAIFREAAPGEVVVVPTADKEAYWVVRVRENATDIDDPAFLEKYAEEADLFFMNPLFGGPYQQLSQGKQATLIEQPLQTLERAYEVQIAPQPAL